ncbi:MAG: substrate-binding domain-containing protein [Cyclobacteriaceae bacterium]
MKHFLFSALFLFAFLCFAQDFKVGFSMDDSIAQRWQVEHKILKRGVENQGGELIVRLCQSNEQLQVNQSKELIDLGVDVLIVVPANAASSKEIAEYAKSKSVPVVAYSRMMTNAPISYYLSFDVRDIGVKQAEYALSKVPKGKYVVLSGPLKDNNSKLVAEGQMSVLQSALLSSQIDLVMNKHLQEWTDFEAYMEMNAFMAEYQGDVDVIIAGNDVIAEGAIRAMNITNQSNTVVIGLDAELTACQGMAKDIQDMSVYLPVVNLASTAALLASRIAKDDYKSIVQMINARENNGLIGVPSILLESVQVSKENLANAIDQYGIHSMEQVFNEK